MNQMDDMAPTRQSLLLRLKDWQDQNSWREFFECYWRLIYRMARKAGLSDTEAQDVVQETVLSVAKAMPEFQYDQAKGSFKGWLLKLTRWRIGDQLRKRGRDAQHLSREPRTSTGTDMAERVPDPAGPALEAIWDEEWDKHLLQKAMERVKNRIDARQYQLFELYALKQWSAAEVANTLKVSKARVYLAGHRVGRQVKKEIAQLRSGAMPELL